MLSDLPAPRTQQQNQAQANPDQFNQYKFDRLGGKGKSRTLAATDYPVNQTIKYKSQAPQTQGEHQKSNKSVSESIHLLILWQWRGHRAANGDIAGACHILFDCQEKLGLAWR